MTRHSYQEFIEAGDNGHLFVDGSDVTELAETWGTPLYVVSERQLRHNYRTFRDAFAGRYPSQVEVLFANKALNNPTVRMILNEEGAGGDAFGVGELYIALLAGTPPERLVLNGSNKSPEEIDMAVQAGVLINLDALDELDLVIAAAERHATTVRIGIRIRMALPEFDGQVLATVHGTGTLTQVLQELKWGMSWNDTVALAERAQAHPNVDLLELSHHLGRVSHDPLHHAATARVMVEWSARLRETIGWTPEYIDLGGGYPIGRPEGAGPRGEDDDTTPSFDDYAAAIVDTILNTCEQHGLNPPGLKLEPGRGLSQNAVILLGRVGAVKRVPGEGAWINVDASTNHLPLARRGYRFHAVAANRTNDVPSETVDVVGPLCIDDVLSAQASLPELHRGDLVAIFDAGVYAETMSLQFNGQPRPASVLVNSGRAELITERESIRDIVARYRIPARFFDRPTHAIPEPPDLAGWPS